MWLEFVRHGLLCLSSEGGLPGPPWGPFRGAHRCLGRGKHAQLSPEARPGHDPRTWDLYSVYQEKVVPQDKSLLAPTPAWARPFSSSRVSSPQVRAGQCRHAGSPRCAVSPCASRPLPPSQALRALSNPCEGSLPCRPRSSQHCAGQLPGCCACADPRPVPHDGPSSVSLADTDRTRPRQARGRRLSSEMSVFTDVTSPQRSLLGSDLLLDSCLCVSSVTGL